MSKQFTANDVKENGSVEKGLHIIIDNDVYEMGGFVDEHPGGAKILKRVGGKDASKQFWKVSTHHIRCSVPDGFCSRRCTRGQICDDSVWARDHRPEASPFSCDLLDGHYY